MTHALTLSVSISYAKCETVMGSTAAAAINVFTKPDWATQHRQMWSAEPALVIPSQPGESILDAYNLVPDWSW